MAIIYSMRTSFVEFEDASYLHVDEDPRSDQILLTNAKRRIDIS